MSSVNVGQKGLPNLGNTCYLNSAIQCLSSIQRHKEFVLSLDTEAFTTARQFTVKSYCDVLRYLWDVEPVPTEDDIKVPLRDLRDSFTASVGHDGAAAAAQSDANAFANWLLLELKEAMRTGPGQRGLPPLSNAAVDPYWKEYCRRDANPMLDPASSPHFEFPVVRKSTCTVCQGVQGSAQTESNLPVTLPAALPSGADANLRDCLRDTLVGHTTELSCNTCGIPQPMDFETSIHIAPTILSIYAKRWKAKEPQELDAQGLPVMARNDVGIDFPTTLDLAPLVSQGSPAAAEVTSLGGSLVYTLVSFANHTGTLENGHWTATCMNKELGREFRNYDDSRVSGSVAPPSFRGVYGTQASIFYYVKGEPKVVHTPPPPPLTSASGGGIETNGGFSYLPGPSVTALDLENRVREAEELREADRLRNAHFEHLDSALRPPPAPVIHPAPVIQYTAISMDPQSRLGANMEECNVNFRCLRVNEGKLETPRAKVLVIITAYNEDWEKISGTLHGVLNNMGVLKKWHDNHKEKSIAQTKHGSFSQAHLKGYGTALIASDSGFSLDQR